MRIVILLVVLLSFIGCGVDSPVVVYKKDTRMQDMSDLIALNSLLIQINSDRLELLYDNVDKIRELNVLLRNDFELLVFQLEEELLLLQIAIQNNENNVTTELESLQNQINLMNVVMVNIKDNSVAELINPCDDGPGFDEVIIKLGSGVFIAYFEVGNKRFLSVLENNKSYRTTDEQGCNFRIEDGELID